MMSGVKRPSMHASMRSIAFENADDAWVTPMRRVPKEPSASVFNVPATLLRSCPTNDPLRMVTIKETERSARSMHIQAQPPMQPI